MSTAPATIRAAAEAALSVLPAGESLTVGEPGPDVTAVGPFGAAVRADVTGAVTGTLVVLVAQELVDALRGSPLGELDVAAAVAPALTAAAGALGVTAGPARELPVDAVAGLGELTVLPLTGADGPHAAVVLAVPPSRPTTAEVTGASRAPSGGLDLLHGVEMQVTVELGRARMTVRELLSLRAGSVIELDRAAGSPADVLVNGRLIARGEVVVVDENFGVRITEIVPSDTRHAEVA